jgi:predicted exporter
MKGISFYLGEFSGKHYSYVSAKTLKDSTLQLPEGVKALSSASDLSKALEKLSHLAEKIIVILLVAIFAFCLYEYKWPGALYVFTPPLLSSGLSLGLSALYFGQINIFQILASFLVFSMSCDYAVFHSYSQKEEESAISLAVFMSTVAMIVAFGTLFFSQTLAISSFGLTITLGTLLVYFLSPLAQRFQKT